MARWGGDEFMALVEGTLQDAEERAKRVEEWVNGEYIIQDQRLRSACRISTVDHSVQQTKLDMLILSLEEKLIRASQSLLPSE